MQSLPLISRNPTQLAYLSPVVRNAGNKNETSPYHHWAGNDMDVGGGTYRRNDVLLDGTPLEAGPKVAYSPPMDAIAEFNVATNAVDAEYGHSAGGIISMSLKSGTNQYRGSGYFVGRNPDWNAVTNRVARQHSDNTYSQVGGTLGMPLRRNRVFLFGTFESSRVTEVLPRTLTLADRARAARRLLAVVQPRRHAARDLRPVDVALRRRRTDDHPRSVSGQPHSAGPLGSAGRPPHGEPLERRTAPATTARG